MKNHDCDAPGVPMRRIPGDVAAVEPAAPQAPAPAARSPASTPERTDETNTGARPAPGPSPDPAAAQTPGRNPP